MPSENPNACPHGWETAAITALLLSAARHKDNAMPSPEFTSLDTVTGLLSRAALETSAGDLFAAARKDRAPVSIVMIDVEGLAAINSEHGVAAGDAVLAHVARLLALNVQPGVDLIGRLAGATLVLVLPEADYPWASRFAERLRGTLANRPVSFQGQMIEATACFCVASIEDGDVSFADLRRRAEISLALAKAGRAANERKKRPLLRIVA